MVTRRDVDAQLLLDALDAIRRFVEGRFALQQLRFCLGRLLQRQIFLLTEHDQIVALLKVGQTIFGLL